MVAPVYNKYFFGLTFEQMCETKTTEDKVYVAALAIIGCLALREALCVNLTGSLLCVLLGGVVLMGKAHSYKLNHPDPAPPNPLTEVTKGLTTLTNKINLLLEKVPNGTTSSKRRNSF